MGVTLSSSGVFSETFKFNPSLIEGGGKHADLSVFDQGGQLPGNYYVDIYVNNEILDKRNVIFKLKYEGEGKNVLSPCLTGKELSQYGVDMAKFKNIVLDDGSCIDLDTIPSLKYELNFNAQALELTIPNKYLLPKLNGIAPQTLWDDGIPAFLMNYDVSSTRTELRTLGQSRQTTWLQLSPGLNIGPWRLRNTTVWQQNSYTEGKWQTLSSYAERGFNSIGSRLTVGDAYTQSDIFDSIPLRGLMLNSDDSMVSPDEYEFVPTVRGIARTQARVEITQNGYTIYNGVVEPGPFTLKNVNANASGGDLKVTIWETDGHPQIFTVPFESPVISVKKGYLRYSVSAGYYKPIENFNRHEKVLEATAEYGLPLNLTVYGGGQGTQHFQSSSLGLGAVLGDWGAVSADLTHSRTNFQEGISQQGDSYRLRYNKLLTTTGTNLAIMQYQYNEGNYNTLSDALENNQDYTSHREKSRTGLSINQSINDWGSLSFSGYINRYRNGYPSTKAINAAYSFTLGPSTISVNFSQTQSLGDYAQKSTNHIVSLWISLPLSRWIGGKTYVNYRWSDSSTGGQSHTIGLSGNNMNRSMYWSASQSYRPDNYNNRNSGNLSVTGYGTYGQLSGNYSYSPEVRQTGAAMRGGIIIHRHGITFGQPLSDTIGLIEAPGAAGVKIGGMPGVRTDFRGYSIYNSLISYQKNDVSIDPAELPSNVEITKTDINVVPTEGAVVPVKFATHKGAREILTVYQEDGSPIPFGALATFNSDDSAGGIVGESGEVYLTGLKKNNVLNIKWTNHQCRALVILPEAPGEKGIFHGESVCKKI